MRMSRQLIQRQCDGFRAAFLTRKNGTEVGAERRASVQVGKRKGSPSVAAVRRTRSGDAWDRAEAESCAVPSPASGKPGSVSLGLPSLRVGPPPTVSTIPIYDVTDGLR